jgi:hypothetical protein
MKKKNKQKLVEILKKLDLYKRIEPKMYFKLGESEPIGVCPETYVRLNDIINWEEWVD